MRKYLKCYPSTLQKIMLCGSHQRSQAPEGALVAETIELRNWRICFGYVLEELGVVVANLDD